ncbi:MAG: hypothetical protein HY706_04800 [Candidatus Hydrogenedentes bacterium]|nr:hypothetical protein [Candidatus Hydrogenedentota bacterium]
MQRTALRAAADVGRYTLPSAFLAFSASSSPAAENVPKVRLHRLHEGKRELRVYDDIDDDVTMPACMFAKRLRGYRAMGNTVQANDEQLPLPAASLSVGSPAE